MSRQAIGLIETVGLAAGVEAADAAVKSANVTLIGYELTKGGGMVTIKIAGDVGAVKAAVDAAVAAAKRVSKVWGQLIIPRPHENLDGLIRSSETVGTEKLSPEEGPVGEDALSEPSPAEVEPEKKSPEAGEEEKKNLAEPWDLEKIREMVGFEPEKSEPTCNLCHDPACPRQRGEAKTKCIHYQPEDNK